MGLEKKQKSTEIFEEDCTVSYYQLFRYARWYEILATIVGILLGLASGGSVCFVQVQFGELTTAFVQRTAHPEGTSSRMPTLEWFNGGRRLTNASYSENMDALLEDGIALAIGMSISLMFSLICIWVAVILVNWSALRQTSRIRLLFLQAVMRQDMAWFDTDTNFNLASRMSEDMLKLKDGMGDKLAIIGNLVGTAVLCTCVAIPLGWKLSLACLTVVPFSIAASVVLSNYQTRSSFREMDAYSQAGKQAEEVLKSVRTVVAFGGESKEVEKYKNLLAPAESYGIKRGLYTGLGTGFNWVLTYSLNTIGLAYGTKLVLEDLDKPVDQRDYVFGDILSILFNIYMATQSITFCVPHGETFSAAKAAAGTIFKLLDREPAIDSLSTEGLSPRRVVGDVLLEDVHFSYPSRPDVKVLKGFSIHIRAGETVALVGSSGCGKSTILQLIQRLYDPASGVVKLDGKNTKSLNLGWLRSCLGVVGQEPVLFKGSIHENIAIGIPGATREEVQRVAEMAHAHTFITNLPKGYDTVIGERGASLSGGQKQRIAIARSLLREPAVLLLDEATSALDPHSERQVQGALDRAAQGRTTLVVSHRLSTIVNADRIVCMDQGAIVEQGTHEELLKAKGFYWNLVSTGKDAQEPDIIETVDEEPGDKTKQTETALVPRSDPIRRSRKAHRRHSTRRESHDWLTPRGSISSVMSSSLQNFTYQLESESEVDEDDKNIPPVSDWQLMKQNGPEWMYIVVGSIAAFIQGACFPIFAMVFGFAMGMFSLSNRDEIFRLSVVYSGVFMLVAAIAGISMSLQSYTFTSAGLKMTSRLRQQYFASLLKQEMGFYDKLTNSVGALCSRLSSDAADVQGATGLRIGLILQGFSSVFVGFIMAMSYNWKLTLVGMAFLPLMVGSIWLEGIISQKSQLNERAAMESATVIATEAVISIRTVQSLGVENIFMDQFEKSLAVAARSVALKTRWRGLVLGLGLYVPFLAYCSATVYGTVLVARERLDYSVVLLVNEAIMYGAYMLGQSLVYAPNFKSAKLSGARILATINRVPRVRSKDGLRSRTEWKASGQFHLRDLEFSYPTQPSNAVLRGFDLKVDAGKIVALVGASGCGKSTVLQLLQRFYDPDTGCIELDGRDSRTALTLPRLRRQLGVVQQEPVLFDRSLAENIAYGDNARKVSMQEIIAAAKAANIHSFIVSLPQGYDTNLGSGGAQLSGGQKQRVCIARALIRHPRLLLLDEATSALDANSEKAVTEALEAAAKGRTCITIAHRLSTVKDADIICVVDKGRIVEKGTHAELISLQGHYWKMNKGQHNH